MSASMEKKEPVSLVCCQVRGGLGGASEIVLSKVSMVDQSPRKFNKEGLMKAQKEDPPPTEVNDIHSIATNQQVTVTIKVKTVKPTEKVKNQDGKELVKQDCVVANSSGCTRVVVWEQDVGRLQEGSCYKLIGASVCSFCGVTYLSMGGDCTIETVDEISNVAEVEEGELEESGVVRKIVEGEIVGIKSSDEYIGCFSCNAKVKTESNVLGECTKCGLLVKMEKSKRLMTAQVTVSGNDGKVYSLTMFNNVISSIIDGIDGGSIERKLFAPTLRLSGDEGDVVYSAQKL